MDFEQTHQNWLPGSAIFKEVTLDGLLDFYLRDRPEFIAWKMRSTGFRITHRVVNLETEDVIRFQSNLQEFLDSFSAKVIKRGYKAAKAVVEAGPQKSIIVCKIAIDEETYYKYVKEGSTK